MWYREVIGGGRCPVVDTWWQTETGGIMISPLPGATTTKPGSATFPLPGVSAEVVDEAGNTVTLGGGYLTLTRPWPGMLRGIWGDPERYQRDVLEPLPGSLLRRRRRQARRRRLLLAARPRRRRDERVRPPHLHHRGRVGARVAPRCRRGRGRRRSRSDDRPGDHRLRHAPRRAPRPTSTTCAPTSPARSERSPSRRRCTSPPTCPRRAAARSCAACCATSPPAATSATPPRSPTPPSSTRSSAAPPKPPRGLTLDAPPARRAGARSLVAVMTLASADRPMFGSRLRSAAYNVCTQGEIDGST